MAKPDRLAGLTEGFKRCKNCNKPLHRLHEGKRCDSCSRIFEREFHRGPLREKIKKLEASAARKRKLLEKAKQYIEDEFRGMAFDEEQEREWQQKGRDLIAALAAELRGGG